MLELFKFFFSSFWYFIGFIMVLHLVLTFLTNLWIKFWALWAIRKQGYPPPHCDGLGQPIDNVLKDEEDV